MKRVHESLAPRRPTALERMTQRVSTEPDDRFWPLPDPVGPWPYRRALTDVIGETDPGRPLRFHCVGDTGGYRDPEPQRRVAAAMEAELQGDDPARFFFHLGDVVYPHGESEHYRGQFHHAYAGYGAPIFAVPGNHDAENPRLEGELALAPWSAHFCSTTAPLHEAGHPFRPAPAQPHVHWTLVHDLVRIVGLWANHPEGGQFAAEQLDWFVHELADTPDDTGPDRRPASAGLLRRHHPRLEPRARRPARRLRDPRRPLPRRGLLRPRPRLPAFHPLARRPRDPAHRRRRRWLPGSAPARRRRRAAAGELSRRSGRHARPLRGQRPRVHDRDRAAGAGRGRLHDRRA